MKEIITLPDVSAVNQFVNAASEQNGMVLVTKEGYSIEMDGASLMGMIGLIGTRIQVECANSSELLENVMNYYRV